MNQSGKIASGASSLFYSSTTTSIFAVLIFVTNLLCSFWISWENALDGSPWPVDMNLLSFKASLFDANLVGFTTKTERANG